MSFMWVPCRLRCILPGASCALGPWGAGPWGPERFPPCHPFSNFSGELHAPGVSPWTQSVWPPRNRVAVDGNHDVFPDHPKSPLRDLLRVVDDRTRQPSGYESALGRVGSSGNASKTILTPSSRPMDVLWSRSPPAGMTSRSVGSTPATAEAIARRTASLAAATL